MDDNVTVVGLDDVRDILERVAPNHAKNLMRATVHGIAGEIQKKAKAKVPKRTGNLKKSIKTRRRRSQPDAPVSEVYASTGKKQKNDGFYWRFVEHGTQNMRAQPFIGPSRNEVLANMDYILRKQFAEKLEKAIAREAKKGKK